MGMDLRLLPVDYDGGGDGFSHTVLDTDRDYELYDRITGLNPYERPTFRFTSFSARLPNGETGYGETKDTPYGEPLTFVDSHELAKVFNSSAESSRNKAIQAYLNVIPRTTIALYWH